MYLTKYLKKWPRAGGPVELSYAKNSVQEVARELGIDSGRITKWRKFYSKTDLSALQGTGLSDDQKQIRRLQKELKDALLDRTAEAARYTKNRIAKPWLFGIFSRGDRAADRGKYSDL